MEEITEEMMKEEEKEYREKNPPLTEHQIKELSIKTGLSELTIKISESRSRGEKYIFTDEEMKECWKKLDQAFKPMYGRYEMIDD